MKGFAWRRGRREYSLTDGASDYEFYTDELLSQGMAVVLEGEMGVGKIAATKVTVLEMDKETKALQKVRERAAASASFPDKAAFSEEPAMERLWPRMKEAALEITIAKKMGRPVLLRFHGDADGICGAFAISSLISCKVFQQNSAIYSVKEALRDMAFIGQEGKAIAILLDFGSNEASREGRELLKAGGLDVLVIDHHPYEKEEAGIVNPAIDPEASRFSAGYLCAEVAVLCGMDKDKARELAAIACSGDKSQVVPNGEDEAKKALVLDFLASHISYGNNLDFYRKVMEKKELFSSIAQQANETIEEAAGKAMRGMKKSEENGLTVASFSLEGIAKSGEWPPSSKITTRIFDKLKGEKALVCVGQTERSIIIRLDDKAAERGISANALAEKLKLSMADFVEGGGGHVRAGAIRAREGFAKEVLNELLREISTVAGGSQVQE
ncbi:MAG: DHH family phosphoesterase [Candidatus Micrarchaeota archaeon]